MKRFRRRTPAVCFCDGCARVEPCDVTAKLDRARQRDLLRHAGLPLR